MLAATIAHAQDTVYYYPRTMAAAAFTFVSSFHRPVMARRSSSCPRVIPMGYGEQHYDRFVDCVQAFSSNGEPLPVSREDGPRWRLKRVETSFLRVRSPDALKITMVVD